MATIQIRNVPEDVARTFKVRAANAGQSLQEYLLSFLVDEAAKPPIEELLARLELTTSELEAIGGAHDLPLEDTLRGIDETWE
jgi:plasmid stability protein